MKAKRKIAERMGDEGKALQSIVEYVSAGRGLTSFAKENKLSIASLHGWIRATPERAEQYDKARLLGADALVEQSVQVLNEAERNANGDLTSPGVLLAKTKSETLRWIAARLAPKSWGDSININAEMTVRVDLPALLAKREARLQRIDAEVIEGEMTPISAPTRNKRAREALPMQTDFQQSPETMNHDNP